MEKAKRPEAVDLSPEGEPPQAWQLVIAIAQFKVDQLLDTTSRIQILLTSILLVDCALVGAVVCFGVAYFSYR